MESNLLLFSKNLEIEFKQLSEIRLETKYLPSLKNFLDWGIRGNV